MMQVQQHSTTQYSIPYTRVPIEKFYLVLKKNKKIFVEKNRGFVDSGFVKTFHEHVITEAEEKDLQAVEAVEAKGGLCVKSNCLGLKKDYPTLLLCR